MQTLGYNHELYVNFLTDDTSDLVFPDFLNKKSETFNCFKSLVAFVEKKHTVSNQNNLN